MPKGIYKHKPHSEETKEKIRKKRYERKSKLGFINSIETRKKMSEIKKQVPEEKHARWKEKPSYSVLHIWVKKHLGKPTKCSNKNCNWKNPKRFEWANISRKYLRDIKDWISLCPSCHKKADFYNIDLRSYNEFKERK